MSKLHLEKRRDIIAARIAGRIYSMIASREARDRLLRVLRTGDPDVRVPLSSIFPVAVDPTTEDAANPEGKQQP